eukprot:TRINITY_DN18435_c0_g1_i1.p1 TRINITY_DN18435_c0_g1~~TRINITY_DN18435_c0_g1_i1.p1  ORF type:complete len:448 (+),score=145.22 TRINITY_DN18435_c0_g1_i1:82-1344(+)
MATGGDAAAQVGQLEQARRGMVAQEEEMMRDGLRRMEMAEYGTRDIAEEGKRKLLTEMALVDAYATLAVGAAAAVVGLVQKVTRVREIVAMQQVAERVRLEEGHEAAARRIEEEERATWTRMVQWGRKKECVIDKLTLARKWVESQCAAAGEGGAVSPRISPTRQVVTSAGGGARGGATWTHKRKQHTELQDLQKKYLEVTKAGAKASQKLVASRRRPCSGRTGIPARPEATSGATAKREARSSSRVTSVLKIRGTTVSGDSPPERPASGTIHNPTTPRNRAPAHPTPHTCPPLQTYMNACSPGLGPQGVIQVGEAPNAQGAPQSWARWSPDTMRTASAGFSRRLTALQARQSPGLASIAPVVAQTLPARPTTAATNRAALCVQESIAQKPVHQRGPLFHTPAKPAAKGHGMWGLRTPYT